MKIYTDVDSIHRSMQDVSIKGREGVPKEPKKVSDEPEDVVRVRRENMAASAIRLEDAEAAITLLRKLQEEIHSDPMTAILAQANIVASNVTGLVG